MRSDIKKYSEKFEQKFDRVDQTIKQLENKIDKLTHKIDKLIEICSRMDDHIDFVEHTYAVLRTPLDFVKRNVEFIMGSDNEEETNLPLAVATDQSPSKVIDYKNEI